MAITIYRDINWAPNEYLSTDKLNAMVNNSRYLFERAPKLYYNAYSIRKDSGVRIACGTTTVPPTKSHGARKVVYFGSFFTVGCKPVIITSITSPYNRRLTISQHGIQGDGYVPDHTGFTAYVATATTEKSHYLVKQIYVNWIAMGY